MGRMGPRAGANRVWCSSRALQNGAKASHKHRDLEGMAGVGL